MESPLPPRESGQFVAERSRDVSVEEEGVRRIAEMLYALRGCEEFTPQGWKKMNPLAPSWSSDEAINWVFVVDTMNFSFWHPCGEKPCTITYKGKTYSGYMALCAAVTRAMDEGVPITDAAYMASVTLEELRQVLRSDNKTPMPMLEERHRVLNEAGRVLLKYGGSLRSFMGKGDNDAEKLVGHIVDSLPSYRDEAVFEGKNISFYKRAQILVADFWGIMEARGEASIPNINYLTMFADYRVPQALIYLGALRYSEDLMKTLNEGLQLPSGDRREVEIRGCSICCVERIKTHLWCIIEEKEGKRNEDINSAVIDFFLWSYAKEHHMEMSHIPIHLTRCIYY
ncbi:queuosine 5'-phosphate N-glycosylase/hydrolase [Scleropages formosus]|uniref:Queuosine 5'-phosphate N-glycosylase/hydrolase n=1 Tax=Scleropages formosus TaxID=113540 RepID=A0A8C9TNQ0_SCLFO|nr:queuosine salvage protein [Scleropages formosus]XP_018614664.1 queuosine salvage protein [Scleropages formosus]